MKVCEDVDVDVEGWKCAKVWTSIPADEGFRQQKAEAARGRGSGVFRVCRVCQWKEGRDQTYDVN